jgi:hypothetical protein
MTSAGAARESPRETGLRHAGSPGRRLEGKMGGGEGGALHSVGLSGRKAHGAPAAARPFRRLQAVTEVPLHNEEGRSPPPRRLQAVADVSLLCEEGRPPPVRGLRPPERTFRPRHEGPPAAGLLERGCWCRKPRPTRPLQTGAPCAARATCPTVPHRAPLCPPACPASPLRSRHPVSPRPVARPQSCRPHPRSASVGLDPRVRWRNRVWRLRRSSTTAPP